MCGIDSDISMLWKLSILEKCTNDEEREPGELDSWNTIASSSLVRDEAMAKFQVLINLEYVQGGEEEVIWIFFMPEKTAKQLITLEKCGKEKV